MYIRAEQIEFATDGTLGWLFSPSHPQTEAPPDPNVALAKQTSGQTPSRSPGLSLWLESGEDIFWIRGKPGSGKSTAMKHLFISNETNVILNLSGPADEHWHALGFFFTDRGSETQKSWNCMLHAILHEFLKEAPEMARVIIPIGMQRVPGHREIDPEKMIKSISFQWTHAQVLEKALLRCKRQTLIQFKALVLLDALDEHNGSHQNMANFLKQLGARPKEDEITHIKICVSSRELDELEDLFDQCPNMKIHEFTKPDIDAYVRSRMQTQARMHTLLSDSDAAVRTRARNLMRAIAKRAQGVFLWVRLVVDELIHNLDLRKPLSSLERILYELPGDLNDFFVHMLKRVDRSCSRESFIILEAVLRARAPLTVIQIAMLIYVNTDDKGAKVELTGRH